MSSPVSADDISCGIGNFRPKWMKRFANPKVFMINFSLLAIVQAAYTAYLVGNLSTLEKRFSYSTKMTGFILIADNISQFFINPVIGYIGKTINKAKLMALGMIIISISCLLSGFPYFFYGKNDLGNTDLSEYANSTKSTDRTQYCKVTIGGECDIDSESDSSTIWPAFVTIFMASFLNGIGNTCFYTLGIPYIDDNVSKRNAPVYLSALACIRLLGPAAGFMLASICLGMFEDPSYDPGYGRNDPRWIGAWWLGFILIGALLFFISIPLFLFPKQLKVSKKTEVPTKALESTGLKENKQEELTISEDVITSLKRLAKNRILVLETISKAFGWTALGGLGLMQPKYIETQYGTSASKASLLTGTTSTIAFAIGMMSGGILIRIFKPRPRVLTSLSFLVHLFIYVELFSALNLGCPRRTFFEESVDLKSINLFKSTCNHDCSCSQNIFQPVCGMDGKTNYFSPCAAGCHTPIYDDKNMTITGFKDCGCASGSDEVTSGYCDFDCGNNLRTYLIIQSIGKLLASSTFAGNILITLRCVEPQDKGFSIGVTKTLLALFSQVPSPLLYGAIVDSACLIWESSTCGSKGSCWFYDSDKMRTYIHWTTICLLSVSSLLGTLIIYYSTDLKDLYGEENADPPIELVENGKPDLNSNKAIGTQLKT